MVILIFFAMVLALLCLFLALRGIFTERQVVVQSALVSSPVKALAMGVMAALITFGIFVGLHSTGIPALGLVSIVFAALVSIAALFGLAAVANTLGERVLALRQRESTPFAQTSAGTVVLATMGALPFLGWFVIAPIAGLLGLGAVIIAARQRGIGGQAIG